MTLLSFLRNRLIQLNHRKWQIEMYVKKEAQSIGSKNFSLDDIPKLDKDIEETKAALAAVEGVIKLRKKV